MRKLSAAFLASSILMALAPARADILVGFVTGQSGPLSSIGIPNARGIAAGLAWQDEVSGEKIKLIQLDDGSDPTTATQNARKLVERDKVDFLIGTSGAPQTFAMATTAAELQTPMVAVSPIAPPPPGVGGPWVVQIPQPQTLLAKGVVNDMNARKLKTIGFIGFSDALGDLMHNSLVSAVKDTDVKVVNDERYARTDTSVVAQVLKTMALRPDAIMIGGTATPGALPMLTLADKGYKGAVYGNNGVMSQDFLRVAGAAANGLVAPTGPVIVAEQLPDSNPIKKVALAFRAAYKKANGAEPTDAFAPYAFDGWVVFVDAAKRALATGARPGTPAFKQALREALFTTKEVVGAHAVYNFTPASSFGVDERSRVMVKLQNGGWVLIPNE
ncbi:MAG: ABC transporter substrate-binding protein [Hyphomicrobiales bacterium]|nr:ABC transporter substrate-binding protein [Hyphomicrobiales bacterium]